MMLALAGCGGKPAARPHHDGGDAGSGAVVSGAADRDAGAPARDAVSGGGTIAVMVQWPDAPAAMRVSPGVTACATARPPRARIGALHGVGGAVVMIDGAIAGGRVAAAVPVAPVRVTVRDCALAPRTAVAAAGATLEVQAQDDAGHAITIAELGPAWSTVAPQAGEVVTHARLPVWGHTVALPMATAGVRRIGADGADDAAYVIVTDQPYAAVTADDGSAALTQVPAGTHTIVAWLAPAAGQPALVARGQATVVAGDRVELTLRMAP